jgi:eukaryotic-like serine/threonine-protein kinase
MSEPEEDRVQELFNQAVALPVEQRNVFLEAACAGEPALRAEVKSLLAADANFTEGIEEGLLKSPLVRALELPASGAGEALPGSRPPDRPVWIGRYRILRRIAEGGMGAVYEAEQDSPRRLIALKVLRPGLASPTLLRRFRHEAQILGRLHHPGIAQVHEAGLAEDGQPFFAMELIRGLPLDEYARRQSLTVPARLELLARVCDGVQHAHEQGVIHRDLKPANILVDESGQPKVLDFGVARATAADLLTGADLTQTGQLLGTPSYMSPEQMTANPAAIDPRADVYALGVVLFELLARRLPYRLENRPLAEAARVILEEEPPRLGSLDPELRGDVETIVARALEKEPARRYPSAGNLAADLRRFLSHEPILARPPSALYQLRKFARRHKALVGGVAATGAALVLGLIGTILFAVSEARQRDLAEQNARAAVAEKRKAEFQASRASKAAAGEARQREQAEQHARAAVAEKREAEFHAYRARMAAAVLALSAHDVADARRHLDGVPKELRAWEWRHLHSRLDDSALVRRLPSGHPLFLLGAPDQLRFATFPKAGVAVIDLESGKRKTLPIRAKRGYRITAAQTRLGLRVAVWVNSKTFELLDESGKVLCRANMSKAREPASVVVVSQDGMRLASHWREGEWRRLAVFDANSSKQTAVCEGHCGRVLSYVFSPDGTRLASVGDDQTARLWDAATGTLLATCKGHTATVYGVAFRPDGKRLVTTSSDGTVRQWDAAMGQEVEPPYTRHSSEVAAATYSPCGQWVVSGGSDRTVRVWRATGRQDVAVLHGHTGPVIQVAFAPGGRQVASLSGSWIFSPGQRTAAVWDVDPESPLPVLGGHTGAVRTAAYSQDGRWIASGSLDRTVRLWDAVTGEWCATLPHPGGVPGLAFGPDGKWLVTVNHGDNRLRIWDVATARVRKEIQGSFPSYRFVTVSPDGKRLAATVFDGQKYHFQVCEVATGKQLFSAEGMILAYSPDGRWLAAQSVADKTVLLLDARSHKTVARFQGHRGIVWGAAFSPDSRHLATGSRDHTIRLWQIDNGKCRVLRGHTDDVSAVAFHPDGKRLATAGRDRGVWLWDLARGQEVARLQGHTSVVRALAFSPDGATLASGSGDTTVRLWDTAPLKVRYQARREVEAARPEAARLVTRLFAELTEPARVVSRLQADSSLSAALRRAALQEVMRQGSK